MLKLLPFNRWQIRFDRLIYWTNLRRTNVACHRRCWSTRKLAMAIRLVERRRLQRFFLPKDRPSPSFENERPCAYFPDRILQGEKGYLHFILADYNIKITLKLCD